jgi:hypothetical protein
MDTEPCFEGAAFYSLSKDLQELVDYIKKFSKKEEKVKMDKTLFRISDNEKADILFDLINPNFNEEGGWQLDGIVTEVYDDYALCVSPTGYRRVYYTKDGDNISIGESVNVQIVDVTESEYSALEAMKAIGGTYEAANNAYVDATVKVEALESEKASFEAKITEYEAQLNNSETTEETSEESSEESSEEPATENSVEETSEEPVTENSNADESANEE